MRKSFYAIGMLCGVLHAAANAETITWQGGDVENPGSWSAAANWDLNRLPQSADDIVIANGDNVTLDVADDFTLEGELRVAGNSRLTQSAYKYMHWNKITLDGGVYVASEAYALDLRGQTTIANCGGLIFAGKAITIVAGNSITVAGGRLEAQEIAVEGSLSVDGGTVAAARIGLNGTMSISGGEVALDGGMITRGATSRLELAGGAITLANQNFLLRPDDVYTGGTVRGINEMHQIDADSNFEVELDGTEFYCALISSSSVMKYKFRSGALIASNTSYSGMYSGNGARIAIPTDSTARWTFAGSNAAYSYFQGRAIYAD
ncbi:MAG: hypothetical protein IJ802_03690, partial [Kiritimatiellae bacterium]|nr:hypothetical protein [Kiritimatiellia bacterium]